MRRRRLNRLALWAVTMLLVLPSAWAGEIGRVRTTEAQLLSAAAAP